jgi:hypothetical protein
MTLSKDSRWSQFHAPTPKSGKFHQAETFPFGEGGTALAVTKEDAAQGCNF